jgi:hypothetical protein
VDEEVLDVEDVGLGYVNADEANDGCGDDEVV